MLFKNIRKWLLIVGILAIVNLGFSAFLCAQETKDIDPLKIALLPILDTFPFYVAQEKGYFDKFGVHVKAVPVTSGLERDQLMQSGEIDGMLNEMITTANFNRHRVQVKTVIAARKAYPNYPLFRVLSSPGIKLNSPTDLAELPIGISKNTIIEYVTDRLLAAEGVDLNRITKKSVPVIPERFQLLLQGQIKAATLPDPLAKSALAAGADLVVDDSSHPQFSVSVLSFHVKTLGNKPTALRLFLKAWDRAAADINANPESHRPLLLKKIRVPKNVQKNIQDSSLPASRDPQRRSMGRCHEVDGHQRFAGFTIII